MAKKQLGVVLSKKSYEKLCFLLENMGIDINT